jgi:D-2-hydroxyacid dehydrogenase (NADP+)
MAPIMTHSPNWNPARSGIRILIYVANPEQNGQLYPGLIAQDHPTAEICHARNRAEAEVLIGGADVLLTYGMLLDDALLASAGPLRWIHSLVSGLDWMARLTSLRADIEVTSARGMHGAPVAEMAILLMMALSRRLPEHLAHQRAARWHRMAGGLLFGKTAGIFGGGTIGCDLALRLKALGMNTIGFSASPRESAGFNEIRHRDHLAEIAPKLNFLITLVPLSDETRGIVSEAVFRAMCPEAYLVHLARGPVVSEPALLEALRSGQIAGAGLNVFDVEPLPADHPLWRMENIIVTPHNAGSYDDYAQDSYLVFRTNLAAMLAGNPARMVNRAKR